MTTAKAGAILDYSGVIWESMMDAILATSSHIVSLRGAGSFNGISIADANELLTTELMPRLEAYLKDGRVSVIFDGDDDDPDYPDIGHIMGRLADRFGDRADWYAVQMQSWYRYADRMPKLTPLHSANGTEYWTVVFPDGTFPGDHSHFSQHPRLVRADAYEQWYVGACGAIAHTQLADYGTKAAGLPGKQKAFIFRAPVSAEQEKVIRGRLTEATDPAKIERLTKSLAAREARPYGLLCTPAGAFINLPEYANLEIEVA